jgi:hypothetical protein
MSTAEPTLVEPSPFDVEISIEKLRRYKSPGIDQILVVPIQARRNILCYEIHKLINSIRKKEELPHQWKESVIVLADKI